jgi:hypothetical protein
MDTTEMRDRLFTALVDAPQDFAPTVIEGETDVLGVEVDGELFFVKVIPA